VIIAMTVHLLKGVIPTGACFGGRANDQLPLLDFQIDRSMQVALFNDGLGNPDPSGITDSHDTRFHCFLRPDNLSLRCNYIGITHLVKGSRVVAVLAWVFWK
jgi:hypothetical protein